MLRSNSSRWHTALAALFGGAIAGVTMLSLQVAADQDASTDGVVRQIPYNGTLAFNGEPVTATGEDAPWLRFDLVDVDAPDSPVVYSQSMQTNVFAGRFNVLIGPSDDGGANVQDVIAAADNLALRMTVLNNHNPDDPDSTADDDVTLSGLQRLALSPYAVWATNATHFNVANSLNVDGPAVAGTVQVDGPVTAEGLVQGNQLRTSNIVSPDGQVRDFNDYRLLLWRGANAGVSYGAGVQPNSLFFNSASDHAFYSNGTRLLLLAPAGAELSTGLNVSGAVSVQGGVNVGGSVSNSNGGTLTVNDNLNVNGGVTLTGNLSNPNGNVTVNDNLNVTGNFVLSGTITDSDGNVTIGEAMTVSGDTTVNGLLSTNKFDADNDQSDGCMRMNAVQICWGNVPSGSNQRNVSFRRGFANSNYALTVTPYGGNSPRFFTVDGRSNSGFSGRVYTDSGNTSDGFSATYIAIGRATW